MSVAQILRRLGPSISCSCHTPGLTRVSAVEGAARSVQSAIVALVSTNAIAQIVKPRTPLSTNRRYKYQRGPELWVTMLVMGIANVVKRGAETGDSR